MTAGSIDDEAGAAKPPVVGHPSAGTAAAAPQRSHSSDATAATIDAQTSQPGAGAPGRGTSPVSADVCNGASGSANLPVVETAPAGSTAGMAAELLRAPRPVAAQQAGAWSASEQQRRWQHLQAAVSTLEDAPQQNSGKDNAAAAGQQGEGKVSASGLTHSDGTTQSDRSGQGRNTMTFT